MNDDIEIASIWIPASYIHQQFIDPFTLFFLALRGCIESLISQVRNNRSVYCNNSVGQQWLDTAWQNELTA
jgi:hypothetical protein